MKTFKAIVSRGIDTIQVLEKADSISNAETSLIDKGWTVEHIQEMSDEDYKGIQTEMRI